MAKFLLLLIMLNCYFLYRAAEGTGYNGFTAPGLLFYGQQGGVTSIGHSQSQGDEFNLIRALIGGNYSKWVKPKPLPKQKAIVVQTRMFLIRIHDLDEAQETIYSTVRFQLNWQDPALQWNPTQFGNLTSIVVPGGMIWLPDLLIVNAVNDMYSLLQDATFSYRVDNDGNVWYHPTGRIATRCSYDFLFYPFDYQRCLIILESVIHEASELKLVIRGDKPDPISLAMLAENEVWELMANRTGGYATAYQSGDHTVFSRVHFWFVVRRKPAFYVMTIVIPTILLAIMTLFTFLVPVQYVDRTIQAVTVLLAVAVFEVTVTQNLPKTASNCLFTIYLTVLLCTSAITIFTTTLCLAIVDPGEFIEAPWGLPNLTRTVTQRIKKTVLRNKKADNRLRSATSGTYLSPASSESSTPDEPSSLRQHHELVPNHPVEPERHFSTSKAAWYLAYAINWIGFVVCLMASVIAPFIAFIAIAPSHQDNDPDNQADEANSVLSSKVSSYYGEW